MRILFLIFLLVTTNSYAATIKLGNFAPTFYWVGLETVTHDPKTNQILDRHGNVIATVTKKFFSTLTLEGTGKLLDGRVINFDIREDGETRYLVCPSSAPYGYGGGNTDAEKYPLIPFQSIAVDPDVVPLGSVLFIPKAVGILLPNGTKHNGYFLAVDTGGDIIGKRIDMFTGFGDQSRFYEKQGIENMIPIEVDLVK